MTYNFTVMLLLIAVLGHNQVQPSTIKYNQVENLISGLKVLSMSYQNDIYRLTIKPKVQNTELFILPSMPILRSC